MSLKSDSKEFQKNEKTLEPCEGSPTGTHFVVIALLICLVFVGIYFVATNASETEDSTTLTQQSVPTSNPALAR